MPPDYLDTRQLEAFVAVVSIGSMTGAARALGKSQPVITRLIQDLEQDLGFAVLHRNGPRIAPTEQGVAFFAEAERFLGGLRILSERARQINASEARPIKIAAIPSIAAGLMPRALRSLESRLFPQHVHMQSTPPEHVVQAVVARTADLGFSSLPLEGAGIDLHWVGEVPCIAVVASDNPLARKAVLEPADLHGQRIIASSNPYRLRMRINEALNAQDIRPAAVIDNNATYVSLSLALAGLGVAIVESVTVSGLPIAGLTVLPLSFHIPFQWGAITASGAPLSDTVERLIASVEEEASLLAGFRKNPAA